MKKHDALFIAALAVSIFLLGLTAAENMSLPAGTSGKSVTQPAGDEREKLLKMGLPLHEARYWKTYE